MEEEKRTNAEVNGDVSMSKYVRKSKPGLVAVCLFVVVCMGVLSGCKKATVKVQLTCETEDAELYVDGKHVGTNDWAGMVSAGPHTAEARKEGLGTLTYTFRADTGEVVKHIFPELPYVSGTLNGHAYVDLGLSVKWATCNVGADTPSDYGDYYAWGETMTKEEYNEDNSDTYGMNLKDIGGNVALDAARANWGGTWRLPTEAECQELIDNCTWIWTSQGGTGGYKVTSEKNGNSIFLPAAGWRDGSSLTNASEDGSYWSSSPGGRDSDDARNLYFYSSSLNTYGYYRYNGFSVRPVSE